jgi:dihydropyrimidinase
MRPARQRSHGCSRRTIAVGSDADLVIFDPGIMTPLGSDQHTNCDYNGFEARKSKGPSVVIVRGKFDARQSIRR